MSAAAPSGATRHADRDVGLEVSVPRGWVVGASAAFPLVLLAPEEEGFRANVGVCVGELVPATARGFAAHCAALKQARARELPGFCVVAERVGTQVGWPGWQLRARFEHEGRVLTQVSQLFVVAPTRCYEITATCLAGRDTLDLPVLRQILSSWLPLEASDGGGDLR